MLKLDGAKFDIETRELNYKVPAPFGPKRGPAFVKIIAKPASAQNPEFKTRIDKLLADAKIKDLVRNKRLQEREDYDEFVKSADDDVKKVNLAVMKLSYDVCVISWETNIQNEGSDLEPTRENFLALFSFEHEEITKVFEKFKNDLTDFAKWQNEVEKEIEDEELGN
jgi:hypothetical protein